jgi:hypothetical protein
MGRLRTALQLRENNECGMPQNRAGRPHTRYLQAAKTGSAIRKQILEGPPSSVESEREGREVIVMARKKGSGWRCADQCGVRYLSFRSDRHIHGSRRSPFCHKLTALNPLKQTLNLLSLGSESTESREKGNFGEQARQIQVALISNEELTTVTVPPSRPSSNIPRSQRR